MTNLPEGQEIRTVCLFGTDGSLPHPKGGVRISPEGEGVGEGVELIPRLNQLQIEDLKPLKESGDSHVR